MLRRRRIYLPEVLFEFRRIGRTVRVSAIDPKTGTEVVMVGDSRSGMVTLKRNAARKLAYVLAKRQGADSSER